MRSKGFVLVYVGAGKIVEVECADLEEVDGRMVDLELRIDDVRVYPAKSIKLKRSLSEDKAPRKSRAKPEAPANGRKAKPVIPPRPTVVPPAPEGKRIDVG